MEAIEIQNTENRYIISIDKNFIDKETITDMYDKLRMEYLAHKVDFSEEIIKVGEEIKKEWWNNNKQDILGRINK